ncbi:hypothetical protein VTJ83DRAFT_687 [Remersonia thermophila]|uniref:Alpha-galactosidase n=1 Tax=Remersonia thermophila TaxID=72144 RepID=A0ABR4DMA6_9PEZI
MSSSTDAPDDMDTMHIQLHVEVESGSEPIPMAPAKEVTPGTLQRHHATASSSSSSSSSSSCRGSATSMAPFVATYPPLGQVTQLQDDNVTVHAVLQVPAAPDAAELWQLALWYLADDGDGDGDGRGSWTETEFVPSPPHSRPVDVHDAGEGTTRLYFRADVTARSSLSFTVKFRHRSSGTGDGDASDGGWRWVQSEQGSGDGVVIIDRRPTRDDDPEDLPDLIHDCNPALRWRRHLSQTPRTRLWSVEAPVDAARHDVSAVAEVPFGFPWGRFLRWFALVRQSAAWLAPRHGKSTLQLDKDALLCSFLSPRGKHLVFLGVGGVGGVGDVVTLFRSGESGRLILHLQNDGPGPGVGTALVAVGDSLESAIAAVMYHARTLVKPAGISAEPPLEAATTDDDDNVQPLWYENWYDGLGYCTWNSLGQDLTAEKVLQALDTLAENKIYVSSVILDDNWQSLDRPGQTQWERGWNDFEADPQAFPGGLKSLVDAIRSRHKHIHHIAVWHAMLGYWGGISPSGPLARRYETIAVPRRDSLDSSRPAVTSPLTLIAPSDVGRFYNDFYAFLSARGITGVKTDAQYMLDTLLPASARRALLPAYLNAWNLATARHFAADRAISCMAHAPGLLFRGPLARAGRFATPPWRSSDDFFPDAPAPATTTTTTAAAQTWHVWANAHNALLAQHLGVLPDWDMFQTDAASPWAGYHAAARCVSGGPVYVTDAPGRHGAGLVRQVAGRTARARRRAGYRGFGEGGPALLKVGAFHGRAGTGTGIVAVFSLLVDARPGDEGSPRRVAEVLALGDFPGVAAGRRYVVRAYRRGTVTPPLEAAEGDGGPLLTVELGAFGYDVLCAYPLTAVGSPASAGHGGEVLVANLGLVDKMTGCAAVLRTGVETRENGTVVVEATLKTLGVLGIYISALGEMSLMDDFMVTILGQPVPPHTVSISKQDGHVLEVDVETAWDEMGLDSGWANEVQVKVLFSLEKR